MKYLIGNWKMQLDNAESEALAAEVVRLWAAQAASRADVSVAICPSHLAFSRVAAVLKGTSVGLGAQDCFWADKGAFTGEVAPKALKEMGGEFCLVGHSERREHLGETDGMVRRKTAAALEAGLTPVVCVGETMDERRAGKRDAVVIAQVRAALEGLQPVGSQKIIVAYEPRWVIGSGQAVEPADAAASHVLIRETLRELFPAAESQCAIVYGGSVDAANIGGFLALEAVQGLLVGGASLKAQEFVRMAELCADAA